MKAYREPNLLKEFYSNNKNNIEVYLKVRYLQKPIFFFPDYIRTEHMSRIMSMIKIATAYKNLNPKRNIRTYKHGRKTDNTRITYE